MTNIEYYINRRFPDLEIKQPLFFKTLATVLRLLFHEKEFRLFHQKYPHLAGQDYVEQLLNYFEFDYAVYAHEREHIPQSGRLVIVANHPIGSLDGLALFKLISEIRHDVKILSNQVLADLDGLNPILIKNGDMGDSKKNLLGNQEICDHLENEGALILFPAGQVSQLGTLGIKDGKWNKGFLKLATRMEAPILPVYVDGRNSAFFYTLSLLARPLSSLWLVREMFKQARQSLQIRIGNVIEFKSYNCVGANYRQRTNLMRKHVYRLAKRKASVFTPVSAIASAEPRQLLRKEIRASELLGHTRDNKEIYLYQYKPDSCVMREISRLREVSFRAVGEGTGSRRDMDQYDAYYQHIILWDDQDLEVVGSYRIGVANDIIETKGIQGLYSATLFDYQPAMNPILKQGLELGRSFVQPRYWGKRSLDYLWFGIGAFLRAHPEIRYLFGPVSISGEFSDSAKASLVHVYGHYFSSKENLALARTPYNARNEIRLPDGLFAGDDYKADFVRLKSFLAEQNFSVPTLYKQYTDICELGGVQFAGFNVDPDFSDCIDGLVIVDTQKLKPKKTARYIGSHDKPNP